MKYPFKNDFSLRFVYETDTNRYRLAKASIWKNGFSLIGLLKLCPVMRSPCPN